MTTPSPTLLAVEGLTKHFPVRRGLLRRTVGQVQAVTDVSFEVGAGETLAIVGESGCGKSTLGRAILKLVTHTAGQVRHRGEVVAEMNRVGLVVDMSHSGDRSTLEAIEHSGRPIAITHANAKSWHPALRNKTDEVLRALGQSGGMLGVSTYPHHLRNGSACTLQDFCDMIARTAEITGPQNIGIGTDLCQDQPDSIVEWMRVGRWTKGMDYGEGSAEAPGFPAPVTWHRDNRDLAGFAEGLRKAGLSQPEIDGVMGGNWARFYAESFGPLDARTPIQRAAE